MPRGKFVNHKGRSRHFSSPEELRNQNKEIAKEKEESTSEEEEDDDDTVAGTSSKTKSKLNDRGNLGDEDDSETGSDEESSEGEERDARKGVSHLIKIENPNRAVRKSENKVSSSLVDEADKPELSRSDRQRYEKQKARARYEKLHAAGKTRQAKSDLARLELIRQQREEAAAKREAERVAAEERKTKR